MARLEGKKSNAGAQFLLLLIVLVIAAFLVLDYLGYVHLGIQLNPGAFGGLTYYYGLI